MCGIELNWPTINLIDLATVLVGMVAAFAWIAALSVWYWNRNKGYIELLKRNS